MNNNMEAGEFYETLVSEESIARENIIDNKISYSPIEIYRWASSVTQDPTADAYQRDLVADMIFKFFIGNEIKLNSSAKYFVTKKPTGLLLMRDRGDDLDDRVHDYIVTSKADNKPSAIRKRMTLAEARLVKEVMIGLGHECTIVDMADAIR